MSDFVVPAQRRHARREGADVGKTMHLAVSVDIDRYSDETLTSEWLPTFRQLGAATAADIRRLCAEERAKGHKVFPPCDHVQTDGHCAGHEEQAGDACRKMHPHAALCCERPKGHDGECFMSRKWWSAGNG